MKTTLDLPDDLLIAAKQVAVRRRTTLKDMVAHSLRREIGLDATPSVSQNAIYEMGEHGLLRLKKRGAVVTSELVYKMMEDEGI
ncbi:MAG: hypothetical protein RL693_2380 [Verrucomicrobiota bacterium]|jgi:hypothetical protein